MFCSAPPHENDLELGLEKKIVQGHGKNKNKIQMYFYLIKLETFINI